MSQVASHHGLSDRTARLARLALGGRRHGILGFLPFMGPAVLASIAYMDPGNFATNIQAGAAHGYLLLWVVLLANVIAMLFQALSARLGIVTGHSLASLCRLHFPRRLVIAMWLGSECAAMATDLAESVGAAVGISLLFGLPLLAGLLITFVVTWALLSLQSRGFRPLELIVGGFVAIISLAYVIELFLAPPSLGTGVVSLRGADAGWGGQCHPGRRHRRRDRHAACDLSAFGDDDRPHCHTVRQ